MKSPVHYYFLYTLLWDRILTINNNSELEGIHM